MKKIISSILILLTLALPPTESHAYVQAAVPVAFLVATTALPVGGTVGAKAYLPSGVSASISQSGDVARLAMLGMFTMVGNVPTWTEKQVDTKISASQISAISAANPTTYPLLKAASNGYNDTTLSKEISASSKYPAVLPTNGGTFSQAGKVYNVSTQPFLANLGQTAWIESNYSAGILGVPAANSVYYFESFSGCGWPSCTRVYQISYTPTTTVLASQPKTPANVVQALTGSSSGGTVNAAYQSELDAALKDSTYIPTFTDRTTGLPFAYPANVATPAQVDAYNRGSAPTNAATATQTAATNNSTAAVGAVAAAQAAYNYAASIAAVNPTDATLKQKELDAAAALAGFQAVAAAADAAKAKADENVLAAENAAVDATTEATPMPEPPSQNRKSINFDKWKLLKGIMANVFPFSLLAMLPGFFTALVAEPVAPSFSLPIYGGNSITMSLAIFDPVALACRFLIGLLISVGIIYYLVEYWRGK